MSFKFFQIGEKVRCESLDEDGVFEVVFINGAELAVKSLKDGELFIALETECEKYSDPAVSGNNKGVSMANKVRGQVSGGASRDFDGVNTVADIAAALGASDRTATVNGVPAQHNQILKDYDYVAFADKKTGGQ